MLMTLSFSLLSLLIITPLNCLIFCLQSLSTWFSLNGLILNPSKSESALFGTRQRSHIYVDVKLVSVAKSVVLLADDINILRVIIDKNQSISNLPSAASECFRISFDLVDNLLVIS
jgi:hypothetical protein